MLGQAVDVCVAQPTLLMVNYNSAKEEVRSQAIGRHKRTRKNIEGAMTLLS